MNFIPLQLIGIQTIADDNKNVLRVTEKCNQVENQFVYQGALPEKQQKRNNTGTLAHTQVQVVWSKDHFCHLQRRPNTVDYRSSSTQTPCGGICCYVRVHMLYDSCLRYTTLCTVHAVLPLPLSIQVTFTTLGSSDLTL